MAARTRIGLSPVLCARPPQYLGFDESIDWYCATHGGRGDHARHVSANVNILSIQDGSYNTCKTRVASVRSARLVTRANEQ